MKKLPLLWVTFVLLLSACAPAATPSPTSTASPPTLTPSPAPTLTPTPDAAWDYLALGDSNPGGSGVARSYVAIFAKYIGQDLGIEVRTHNEAFNGATSSRLLAKIKNDTQLQREIREAEIITIDVGANDWTTVADRYPFHKCGGDDNQDCLRELIQNYTKNFEAILDQIDSLHGTNPPVVLRSVDLYLSDCDFPDLHEDTGLFNGIKPYLDEFNAGIATATAAHHGQVVPLYLSFNGPDGTHNPVEYLQFDQCHLSPGGHQTVAEMLRNMGYQQ